jgi:Ca2+/Na+ antiporter
MYSFLALAIVCDRYLVVSLETLCVRWSVREDVAGATFMALGSALPEILINTIGTIQASAGGDIAGAGGEGGGTDLGVGAIIGSGMIAFLVIPGLCGIVGGKKKPLQLKRRALLRDSTFYLLALGLLCIFFNDGVIRTYEAAILIALYVVYIFFVVFARGVKRHYKAYTHRKNTWLRIKRSIASGEATAAELNQLRQSFLDAHHVVGDPVDRGEVKHFVEQAKENREKEEAERRAAMSGSPSSSFPGNNSEQESKQDPEVMVHSPRPVVPARINVISSAGVTMQPYQPPEPSSDSSPRAAGAREKSQQGKRYAYVSDHDAALSSEDAFDPEAGRDVELSPIVPSASPEEPNESPSSSPGDVFTSGSPDNLNQLGPVVSTSLEPEAPPSGIMRVYNALGLPLNWLFSKTTVSCEWDSPHARWYPLTLLVSFAWVSCFSFLISTVVGRWVQRSGVGSSFWGLFLVAIGAEIPDTVQSVTVATRGYGSMAVANSCGSQITNILVGLGLPWFLADLRAEAKGAPAGNAEGKPTVKDLYIQVPDHANLQVASFFQFGNITLFVVLLLLMAVLQQTPKAQLTTKKGFIFISAYIVCVCGYAIYIFA